MSHVDEGTLHAYLDGELETIQPGASAALEAHVAACDECRARLEDERRIRDRAETVLGYASPERLDVPPFDAVLRRARGSATGGGGPASPRPRSFTLPLAWAASIALALAGGWWAREMALGPVPVSSLSLESADLDAVAEAPPAPAPGQAATPALSAGSAATPPDAAAKPSAAAQAGPAREPERADAARARPAEDVSTAPAPLARSRIAGADARQRADSAARARISAFAAPPAADSGGVAGELKVTADAAPPALAAPAMIVPQWAAVDRAEAERRLGGRLLLVEGLEVQSIEVADAAGRPLVRTRQTVAPGVGLVLLQHAAPRAALGEAMVDEARVASPVPARPGAPAPAALVVERGGFLVRLSADLPGDSLRALAGRLR